MVRAVDQGRLKMLAGIIRLYVCHLKEAKLQNMISIGVRDSNTL